MDELRDYHCHEQSGQVHQEKGVERWLTLP